jgi:hypothetical protein
VPADGCRLGIDFGTSNTVAVLAGPDGRARPLLFDGSPLLPSAVFAGAAGHLLVGADALRAAVGAPAGLESNPKRRVDDGTVWLGEREYQVGDLIAAVLHRVAAEATRVAGGTVQDVVLTHPSSWQRHRLGVLAVAAERAGVARPRFVAEPVAAAAYFTTVLGQRIGSERCVVVYDLGAGTFDVSVIRPSPGGFDVIASDGLPDVGGLDLDALVVRHARTVTAGAGAAWRRLDWPQTPGDQLARQALWQAARAVKEQLSRHTHSDLHLPVVDQQIHLTREEFEKAARAHLDRTAELTRAVLSSAGVPPEDVAGVFLVGGSSRIPLAATLLHRTLRIAPTVIDQPEIVVAEGALLTGTNPAPTVPVPVADPVPVAPVPVPAVADPVPVAPVPAVADPAPAVAAPPDPGPAGPPAPTSAPPIVSAPPIEAVSAPPVDTAPPVVSVSPAVSAPPVPADPPELAVPTRAPRRRRLPVLVAAITAAVVLLATATVLAITRPWQEQKRGSTPAAERIGTLLGHTDAVRRVAFSPDGKTLASVGYDRTLRLWDVERRRQIGQSIQTPDKLFNDDLAFSKDGKEVAVAGGVLGVHIWNVSSRRRVGELVKDTAHSVSYSPNGSVIAVTGDSGIVQLWDAGDRETNGQRMRGHTGTVNRAEFSPDSRTLATAGDDGTVRLWNVSTRQAVGSPLTGHTDRVVWLAYGPDGTVVASAGRDRTVRLWNTRTRQPIGAPISPASGAEAFGCVDFSPSGDTLVTLDLGGRIRLWRTASGAAIGGPFRPDGTATHLAVNPMSKTFAVAGTGDGAKTIELWRFNT